MHHRDPCAHFERPNDHRSYAQALHSLRRFILDNVDRYLTGSSRENYGEDPMPDYDTQEADESYRWQGAPYPPDALGAYSPDGCWVPFTQAVPGFFSGHYFGEADGIFGGEGSCEEAVVSWAVPRPAAGDGGGYVIPGGSWVPCT